MKSVLTVLLVVQISYILTEKYLDGVTAKERGCRIAATYTEKSGQTTDGNRGAKPKIDQANDTDLDEDED